MRKTPPLKAAQQGVVLLEAMIAILIFSMGVLAIVGLQAAMIKNTADSKYRSEAGYIAQTRIGQIWADPANAASYVETNTDISALLPSGTRTVTQPVTGQFTVTVTWQQPGAGETQHNFTTTAHITGG
jgi:type IV pilus assembly protein PilV